MNENNGYTFDINGSRDHGYGGRPVPFDETDPYDENKEMSREETENNFRDDVFDIFIKIIPGAYIDNDGFIVIP